MNNEDPSWLRSNIWKIALAGCSMIWISLKASIEITQTGWLNSADLRIQLQVGRPLAIGRSLKMRRRLRGGQTALSPPQRNWPETAVEMR